MIRHLARQRAVGHGGFLTGRIWAEGDRGDSASIDYVYDCGAKHRTDLWRTVRDYQDEIARTTGTIELLVLSHVDADHVNGVERLMGAGTGVRVERVMLPLLSPLEQLVAVARIVGGGGPDGGGGPARFLRAAGDRRERSPGFEVGLITDPFATLRAIDDRVEVILVEPGGPWERHAGLGIDPEPRDFTPLFAKSRDGELVLEMVGSARADERRDDAAHVIGDANGIRIHQTSAQSEWFLAPFVAPAVLAGAAAFLRHLAALIAMPQHDLEQRIEDDDFRAELVRSCRAELSTAYKRAGRSDATNRSSLCLSSSPHPEARSRAAIGFARHWRLSRQRSETIAPGILMTGDSRLGSLAEVEALAAHYETFASQVGLLHAPHHGSHDNFSPELLQAFPNVRVVLAMCPRMSLHHPHPATVDAVKGYGLAFHKVTDDDATQIAVWASSEGRN